MVHFEIVPGRKGPNDELVRVWAYGEVLSFSDVLFILDKYFKSEEGYYPKPRFLGSCMLLEAILEVYSNVPFAKVLKKYGLERKTKSTVVTEDLKPASNRVFRSNMNVAEVLT